MSVKPLRIAQVAALWTAIPPATYGGIELLIYLMIEEMTRRGHHVTLFASGDSRTSAELRSVVDRNVIDLMGEGRIHTYEYYTAGAMSEALRDADQFDVIHSHVGMSMAPLSIVSRTPMVHTIHTAIGPDDQWLFQRYPEVPAVGVSHSQLSVVPEPQRSRLRVVHNACDIDSYDLAEPNGEYLLFLGRMGEHKNPGDAIRIAKAAGMPLVLAGAPQSKLETAYFKAQIEPLIDGKNVRYFGPADHRQKRELFKNAAAFLFPTSWAEPCAVAPLEAMAAGLPVLAYPNGSVPEVIDYGVSGFYADSAEALAALVPQALALDRSAIREHARKRFSHHRLVDEYLAAYQALIERRW